MFVRPLPMYYFLLLQRHYLLMHHFLSKRGTPLHNFCTSTIIRFLTNFISYVTFSYDTEEVIILEKYVGLFIAEQPMLVIFFFPLV